MSGLKLSDLVRFDIPAQTYCKFWFKGVSDRSKCRACYAVNNYVSLTQIELKSIT